MTLEEKKHIYYSVMRELRNLITEALSPDVESDKEPSYIVSDINGEHNIISLRELPFIHDETI